MSLALRLVAASHDGVDVDVSVKACSRQHRGVSGAPLDVKAPLTAGGQLVQHLRIQAHDLITPGGQKKMENHVFMSVIYIYNIMCVNHIYLRCVWIPAQYPVVLPATQKQLGISQTPGDGQDAPAHKEQSGYVLK